MDCSTVVYRESGGGIKIFQDLSGVSILFNQHTDANVILVFEKIVELLSYIRMHVFVKILLNNNL